MREFLLCTHARDPGPELCGRAHACSTQVLRALACQTFFCCAPSCACVCNMTRALVLYRAMWYVRFGARCARACAVVRSPEFCGMKNHRPTPPSARWNIEKCKRTTRARLYFHLNLLIPHHNSPGWMIMIVVHARTTNGQHSTSDVDGRRRRGMVMLCCSDV